MAERTIATLNDGELAAVASVTSDANDQLAVSLGIFQDTGLGIDSTKREYAEVLTREQLQSIVKNSGKAYRNATAALDARFPKVDEDDDSDESDES